MKKTNNKGFSLVELIIVIAIMAVLVGILAPQFVKYVERSRESTDIKNVQEMVTAVQVYAADNAVPDGSSTITLNASGGTTAATSSAASALTNAGLATVYEASSTKYSGTVITVTFASGIPSFTAANAGTNQTSDLGLN